METRIPIGRKYSRLVGILETAFKASNKEILSSKEVAIWVKNNYPKANLPVRRVSVFLKRRPQFVHHTSARMVNSNIRDHWYSLGPSDEQVFVEMNWVEDPPIDKMSNFTKITITECPYEICDILGAGRGHNKHIHVGSFRCTSCQDAIDRVKLALDQLIEQ
jgi:hypothetical protein